MNNKIQSSVAVKPIAPYLGGKRILSKKIIERIDKINHSSYAEPFVGMGGVFLRRRTKKRAEFINDFNNEISNLFRIIQRHEDAFLKGIKNMISTRWMFDLLTATSPHTLTDIDRAVRFFYLQKTGFGGQIKSRNFGVSKKDPSRLNVAKINTDVHNLTKRLASVTIENLDFYDFIKRYDHKDMLFYLDPPYWNSEKDYGNNLFDRSDFKKMAELLKKIKGKFLLSLNDTSEVRVIFENFDIEEVKTIYTCSAVKSKKMTELIISN